MNMLGDIGHGNFQTNFRSSERHLRVCGWQAATLPFRTPATHLTPAMGTKHRSKGLKQEVQHQTIVVAIDSRLMVIITASFIT